MTENISIEESVIMLDAWLSGRRIDGYESVSLSIRDCGAMFDVMIVLREVPGVWVIRTPAFAHTRDGFARGMAFPNFDCALMAVAMEWKP